MTADDEKVCPRCAETIKAAAKVCRYCGHEFGDVSAPAEPMRKPLTVEINGKPDRFDGKGSQAKTKQERGSKLKDGCGCLVVVLIVLAIIGALTGNDKSSSNSSSASSASAPATDAANTPPAKDCRSNWADCADNADMANHWSNWTKVQSACEIEAEGRAKYGTPKWPWIVFGSFHPGDSYVKTGIATAIEPDAQFQNGFGAMVHSVVTCEYDLRTDKVTDVSISAR